MVELKDFSNLLIVTDILLIEEFMGGLFKIMHDLDGDVTSSDGRTLQSFLNQSSERDRVWTFREYSRHFVRDRR